MIREYLDAAMARATYKALPEDGSYYGEIPGFEGVQASAKTLAECRNTLEETLERWALVRVPRDRRTCAGWHGPQVRGSGGRVARWRPSGTTYAGGRP